MQDSFRNVLGIFTAAKSSQRIVRTFTLEEYRDIFLNRSTDELNAYLITAFGFEEYELCGALQKIIVERQVNNISLDDNVSENEVVLSSAWDH